jgi:hypothetical protein
MITNLVVELEREFIGVQLASVVTLNASVGCMLCMQERGRGNRS